MFIYSKMIQKTNLGLPKNDHMFKYYRVGEMFLHIR